jgi:hypothetical protein
MQNDVNSAATPREDSARSSFKTKIGPTTYHVTVHFSKTSSETMHDKILRLIEWEAQDLNAPHKG